MAFKKDKALQLECSIRFVIRSDGQSISAVLVSETLINGWADNAYYVPPNNLKR